MKQDQRRRKQDKAVKRETKLRHGGKESRDGKTRSRMERGKVLTEVRVVETKERSFALLLEESSLQEHVCSYVYVLAKGRSSGKVTLACALAQNKDHFSIIYTTLGYNYTNQVSFCSNGCYKFSRDAICFCRSA